MTVLNAAFYTYDLNRKVSLLPEPMEWTITVPLNDTPTLTLKYSLLSVKGSIVKGLLDSQYDLALELNGQEYTGCRFVIVDEEIDWADPNQIMTLTGVGCDWDLTGVVNLTASYVDPTTGGRRYNDAFPGEIIRSLLVEAHGQGVATATLGVTDNPINRDSAGMQWPTDLDRFDIGAETAMRQVLATLVDMGFIDWRYNGNTLNVFVANTAVRRDRMVGSVPVALVYGREITDLPQKRSRRDSINQVAVIIDKGGLGVYPNNTFQNARGDRCAVVQAGGITNYVDARKIANGVMEVSSYPTRSEYTRTLNVTDAKSLPFLHYVPGDMVLAPGNEGNMLPLRVTQITLSGDQNDNMGGSVTLNDRFAERSTRAQQRQEAISGGATKFIGSGVPRKP